VMRTAGEESVFTKICEEFGKNIERHISVYGADNDQRLTGDPRPNQSISSATVFLTVGLPYEFPLRRIQMAGLDDLRTGERRQTLIHTR